MRSGCSYLMMLQHAPLAAKLLYRTVDAIWYAIGDRSTDFNFYTKRGLLAAVYSATVLYWLNDKSPDCAATWSFLDRRIEEVMLVPKSHRQSREIRRALPHPWHDLSAAARGGREMHGDSGALVRSRAQFGVVAHLAAGPRLGLAVEMQLHAGIGEQVAPGRRYRRRQVLHYRVGMAFGGAKGQAADRADELLELAGDAGIDGPVAGIVRPRRKLVHQDVARLGHEHLDAENADEVDPGDMPGDGFGPGDHRGIHPRRRVGDIENWCLCWFSTGT